MDNEAEPAESGGRSFEDLLRVAYDATTLRPRQTGIGYYTEHLLHHLLLEAPDDVEFRLISNRRVETSAPLDHARAAIDVRSCRLRQYWMQAVVPGLLAELRPDIAHFTNAIAPLRQRVPTVLTVHDMTLQALPRVHPWRRRLFTPLATAALRRADAIITVSDASKKNIVQFGRVPEHRVHVIHEAAAPVFRPLPPAVREGVRAKYGLAERVLLFVGTVEPRKNLRRLIDAFGLLKARHRIPHQLVLVGMFGWHWGEVTRRLEAPDVRGQVRLLGYVSFDDLPALYNLAEVFVFPSLEEGFGLPLVEAMACGVPAVTSTCASLAEVAGGAVRTADALDVEQLAEAIRALVDDEAERQRLSTLGLERARAFSWTAAARRTLGVYEQTLATTGLPGH